MKIIPNRSKGRRYPVEISCVSWMDLLGYGSMLRPVKFNPSAEKAQLAVTRLEHFQSMVAKAADRYQRALIINDGVAYVRQLSPRTVSVTYDFLYRSFRVFNAVNKSERDKSFCGARMVIAAGPRLRIKNNAKPATEHVASILRRYRDGSISPEQAIHEASRSAPYTGTLVELQANFAFTKAYLADSGGSRAGLGGPNLYVDSVLFDDEPPKWLTIAKEVVWKTDGLNAKFYLITNIDNEAAGVVKQNGIRNAIEIARALGIKY